MLLLLHGAVDWHCDELVSLTSKSWKASAFHVASGFMIAFVPGAVNMGGGMASASVGHCGLLSKDNNFFIAAIVNSACVSFCE